MLVVKWTLQGFLLNITLKVSVIQGRTANFLFDLTYV